MSNTIDTDRKFVSLGCTQVQVLEESVAIRRKVKRLGFLGEGVGVSNIKRILVHYW